MDLPRDGAAEVRLKAEQVVRVALVRFGPDLHLVARAFSFAVTRRRPSARG